MAQCKICDKKYHACGSCGLLDWEYIFCSDNCLKEYQDKYLPGILDKYHLTKDQLMTLLEEVEELYL